MEKLMHVKPTKEYERKAIDYIEEFHKYNSNINGVGGLNRFLDDYNGWLNYLNEKRNIIVSEEKVPSETYFLVREYDDKIVGMINIRLALNEKLKKHSGHIGYSIRPTERQKGYNNINLYLGLLCCKNHGIKEVFMDCDKNNLGSSKTIQSLGGKLVKEYYDGEINKCIIQDYIINVNQSLEDNKDKFKKFI